MKFFVTYSAMDSTIANPFWHAFLTLSYWPGDNSKIQVTNAWGFYAAETTTPNSPWRTIKRKVGLDIDLQGNHGLLKLEELRYLDLGYGLNGITFEISFEQFHMLKAFCKKMLINQQIAIDEMTARLTVNGKKPNSKEIYQEEKRCAEKEKRPIRLRPFEFRLCLDGHGLTLNNSYSCKSIAVDILREIGIEESCLQLITQRGDSKAIPRNSGYLEPIYLHSRGPTRQHISERTKKMTLFRTWDDKAVKLYWTFPPQWIPNASAETEKAFLMPSLQLEKVERMVKKLHALERLILNSKIPTDQGDQARINLLQHLNLLGDKLATIVKSVTENLDAKIKEIECCCEDIYEAIIDEWDDEEELATIVASFPQDKQEEICKILNKPYMQWTVKYEDEQRTVHPGLNA